MNKYIYIIVLLSILGIYLYYNSRYIEGFDNLINNGNFEGGNLSNQASGSTSGNTIVKMDNPGKSSYVLEQTAIESGKTRYQLNVDIKPGTNYKLSSWTHYTSEWDGNLNLFSIVVHVNDGTNITMVETGVQEETVQIGENIWRKMEHKFQTPINANGKIDIFIGYNPENSNGKRYITDIELIQAYPLLDDIPVSKGLLVFLSAHHNNSLSQNSNIWKDISLSGNDFTLENVILSNNSSVSLDGNKIVGPPSNVIIPDENKFSILFSAKMDSYNAGEFININANNAYNRGLVIYFKNNLGVNNSVKIYMANKIHTFKVGITQKKSVYAVVYKNSNLDLYKDGFKLNGTIGFSNTFAEEENVIIDSLKINNEPCIINPNFSTNSIVGQLDFFIVYNEALESNQVQKMTDYFVKYQLLDYSSRPSTNFSNLNSATYSTTVTKPCPFSTESGFSPCNSIECCGANWNNLSNVSDKCKLVINSFCSGNTNNSTCNYLRTLKQETIKRETCKSSTEIISSLSNVDEKIESCNAKQNYLKIEGGDEKNESANTQQDLKIETVDEDNKVNVVKKNKSKTQKCKIDMNKYIRKDKIPCWGCNLDNINK